MAVGTRPLLMPSMLGKTFLGQFFCTLVYYGTDLVLVKGYYMMNADASGGSCVPT